MPLELTSAQRRALRAGAHRLQPVVIIGEAGLSPSVLAEIDRNLSSHELIKIRVFSAARDRRNQMRDAICKELAAAPVQHIGKILVIYRPLPAQDAKPAKSPRPRRKPPRRTKRSFQR